MYLNEFGILFGDCAMVDSVQIKLTTDGGLVPYCVHCVGVEEFILHVLRDCPLAHQTWNHLFSMQGRLVFLHVILLFGSSKT
jgi:hypothetical protein